MVRLGLNSERLLPLLALLATVWGLTGIAAPPSRAHVATEQLCGDCEAPLEATPSGWECPGQTCQHRQYERATRLRERLARAAAQVGPSVSGDR